MNKRQFIFKEMNRKMNLTEHKLPAGWFSQCSKVICSLLQERRHEGLTQCWTLQDTTPDGPIVARLLRE